MNKRALTLSLIIAAFSVFMVYSYIDGKESEVIQKYGKSMPVVVAKTDIQELEIIDDTKVTIQSISQNFVAPGAINDIKEVSNTLATVPIKKGEQITAPRITQPGVRTGLARQVSQGKRAVSIQISGANAVSNLIKPGDRVDIVGLVDPQGGKKSSIRVKTILQDVLVLATGMSMTNAIPMVEKLVANETKKINLNRYTEYSSMTFELSPYEAQKLIYMTSQMQIYLMLRNNDDKQNVRIASTKIFDLLDEDSQEVKALLMDPVKK